MRTQQDPTRDLLPEQYDALTMVCGVQFALQAEEERRRYLASVEAQVQANWTRLRLHATHAPGAQRQ